MAQIIKGAEVAAQLKKQMKADIEAAGVTPVLAVVRVGAKESDLAYERGVMKTCGSVGIEVRVFEYPEDIDQKSLEEEFLKVNSDPEIHGILLFKPLPSHLDGDAFNNLIDPAKDMDCMSPVNWAKLSLGDDSGYFPCTAEAVIHILEYAGVNINGANAVVIGRSQVIGKPLGLMLLARSATVTWCHSKTADIPDRCRRADILVSACGVHGIVGSDIAAAVSPDCCAIDVGMNFVEGKMCGDFDFDAVEPHVGMITPVPGGVGSVTNTVMASHVVRAAILASR